MANDHRQNRSGSKRQYGRSNNRDRRGHSGGMPNNRNQTLDSNGPTGRVRGNAYQICERYLSQARDAAASGDRVMAQNLYQHAEHYMRLNNMFNEAREESRKARSEQNQAKNNNEQPEKASEETPETKKKTRASSHKKKAADTVPPGMEEQPSILDAPPPGAPDLFDGEEKAPAKPKTKRGQWRRKPKTEDGAADATAETSKETPSEA